MISDKDIANEIVSLANQYEDAPEFFGPVSEEVVQAAEYELGLKFPKSYRAFLRHLGAAKMLGHDFDGLPNTRNSDIEMSYYLHVVDSTKDLWEAWSDLPRYNIFVTDNGGDCNFWIDTSIESGDNESPIVVHVSGRPFVVADSFLAFVRLLANREALYAILADISDR